MEPARIQDAIEKRFPFLERRRPFAQFPEGADMPVEKAADSLNGMRAIETSRIQGWREHLPRIKGQVEDFPSLPQDLIEAGYETDGSWMQLLEGIERYTQRYKDAPPPGLRRLESNTRYWLKTRRYLRALQG
jgi:hypothetical protein